MYLADLYFGIIQPKDTASVVTAIETLLSALYRNGQILDSDYSILKVRHGYATHAVLPAVSALEPQHHSELVKAELGELLNHGLGKPKVTLLGRDLSGCAYSEGANAPFYILYTYWATHVTPIRRGDTFEPVPLYLLPANPQTGDHVDIRAWASLYKACDTLSGTDSPAAHGALATLSSLDSAITREGRRICAGLEQAAGVPVYYAFTRGQGKDEARRMETLCGAHAYEWCAEPLHNLFDFRCDELRLLSYLPWNTRQTGAEC